MTALTSHTHTCPRALSLARPFRHWPQSAKQRRQLPSEQGFCCLRRSLWHHSKLAHRQTSLQAGATQIEDLAAAHVHDTPGHQPPQALLCVPTSAKTVPKALQEIKEAKSLGAEVIELRLDYLEDLEVSNPGPSLESMLAAAKAASLPAIVTFRPAWEGGKYEGPEAQRLAVLKFAAMLEPAYIDVELLAADFFFAGAGTVPIGTNVILSHHDYDRTPSEEELDALAAKMFEGGADIAKVAAKANDISESMRMLQLAQRTEGPVISLSMGERGLPSRLLASKFGAHLTFGCLDRGRNSAPGQPSISDLHNLYRLPSLTSNTQVFGVIGNPIAHSRSPAIHNPSFHATGVNAIYLPYLVDDLPSFLKNFSRPDFKGFSVTIPHKEAALNAADEVDPVAAQIGAINTLVRQPDGTLKGYNTDWSAAIEAVELALQRNQTEDECDDEGCPIDFGDSFDESEPIPEPSTSGNGSVVEANPLAGLRVVILGAGGSGKALAFGAASRGAKVIIANRNVERARRLAESIGPKAEAVSLDDVSQGRVKGEILLNTTSVGMVPDVQASPISADALSDFKLVFDAIYTPAETTLLKEAEARGCITVSGVEMFVGQAAQQFKLFTGRDAPIGHMRAALFNSLDAQ